MWTVLGGMAGVASLVWAIAFVGPGSPSASTEPSPAARSASAAAPADLVAEPPTAAAATTAERTPAEQASDVLPSATPAAVDPAAGGPVWMAQLASVSLGDTARLTVVLDGIRRDVPDAQVLSSSAYASLRPGFWVVYEISGFRDGREALSFCAAHGRPDRVSCFGRLLSHDAADLVYQCYPGSPVSRCKED